MHGGASGPVVAVARGPGMAVLAREIVSTDRSSGSNPPITVGPRPKAKPARIDPPLPSRHAILIDQIDCSIHDSECRGLLDVCRL